MKLRQAMTEQYRQRPLWMNSLLLFCLYMTFIYVPWDLFIKPLEQDQEVWLGIQFTGWAAKAGGLLHWLVYGAGSWGFWKMRRWMHPWAALYVVQIAVAMFVYAAGASGDSGLLAGTLIAALFLGLATLLWHRRELFTTAAESGATGE